MDYTGIAVIESNWWRKKNTSIRPIFDMIGNICCGNPHSYHYEMVNCESAMKEAIPRIGTFKETKYLYIASHGDKDGIHFSLSGEKISRIELRNILVKIKQTRGSELFGIYIGACSFGTDELADFLFEKDVCVKWIAGYREEISWIESTALDVLFFNALINGAENETDNQKIHRTANRLNEMAPRLAAELGFGIFVRKQKTGGAKDLLAEVHLRLEEELSLE